MRVKLFLTPVRRLVQVAALGAFVWLLLVLAWPYAEVFDSSVVSGRGLELFLWLDPLVGVSTAVAARTWNVALVGTLAILLIGVLFPRGFCGYLCPLGTLIDLFDWAIGKRIRLLRLREPRRWNVRYYVLATVLVASGMGVMLAGYVAAIPVVTRGLVFTAGRAQLGLLKNWGMVGQAGAGVWVSVGLFVGVFLLSLLGPRFWCRYVCPSGALLSIMGRLGVGRRRVAQTCIDCGKCVRVCPFDAIKADFTTREMDCTFCQTCGGACPTGAITFTWGQDHEPPKQPSSVSEVSPVSRRGLLLWGLGGALAAGGTRYGSAAAPLLRPPGSAPERRFLQLCIRCGECFKVCPGSVLQPAGLEAGLDALWTPVVTPTHAGCHQECNFCTQVCPTRAIRPLSIEQKKRAVIGLAVIDVATCLPHRGQRDCRLCYDECEAAGYHAIEMRPIKLEVGEVPPGVLSDEQLEQMGRIDAPFVDAARCVGCGLCEYRCHAALVRRQKLLTKRAVVVSPAQRS